MKSWSLGAQNSIYYRTFDWLRNGLNVWLSAYLYKQIQGKLNVSIIEAGSGPGMCASLLAQKNGVQTAAILDFDSEVLKIAQERDPKLKIIQGDLTQMPLADNSYDLVYNSSTIEHLKTPYKAVQEMARICKKDGYVFIGIPWKLGPLGLFLIFPEGGAVREWVGQFIKENELKNWAQSCQMEFVEDTYYFFRFFKGYVFRKK